MTLSSTYLGPISWYAFRIQKNIAEVESCEHYVKQSYRNRATILGPNGLQDLNIPVLHPGKSSMADIQMSFSENWITQHLKALESAYKNAPFYESVAGELWDIYEDLPVYLFEFNQKLDQVISGWLNISPLRPTENFEAYRENDLRLNISPKKKDYYPIDFPRYRQVFELKHGFQANLSILDLIFNEGPLAYTYLTELRLPQ